MKNKRNYKKPSPKHDFSIIVITCVLFFIIQCLFDYYKDKRDHARSTRCNELLEMQRLIESYSNDN